MTKLHLDHFTSTLTSTKQNTITTKVKSIEIKQHQLGINTIIREQKQLRKLWQRTRIQHYKTEYNKLNNKIKHQIKALKTNNWHNICNDKPQSNPSNYRPISLISNLSKILEKIITTQLHNWAETNNIINKEQQALEKTNLPHRQTILTHSNHLPGKKSKATLCCNIPWRRESLRQSLAWWPHSQTPIPKHPAPPSPIHQ